MVDCTVIYRAGFSRIMQRGRMTEVCWNNNKANVFPVETDTPLMGCQTNFLLSESWRQPNRHSNHNSSHLWALRGNIRMPHYHPVRLMITYRHKRKTQICFTVRKIVFQQPIGPHMLTVDSQACLGRSHLGNIQLSLKVSFFFCCCCLLSPTDARTVWRCCLCAARVTACSATLPWGRATSACSSSKTRP